MNFLQTMSGPDFLILYLVWFLLVLGGVLVLRHLGFDSPLTTIGGLVLFEILGVVRFFLGIEVGMHRWGGLFLMMGLGALFFVVRPSSLGGGGNSSGSCGGGAASSCSGGSSCGGGGCGGGGCGGCGGS